MERPSTETGSSDSSPPRPSGSRHHEALLALRRAQARIDERFERIVEPAGITLQQFRVLQILRAAGDAGLATLTIADRMTDRAPGITRLVDRLERRQLVRRVRGLDRRQVLCSATDTGLALLKSLDRQIRDSEEAVLGSLTRNEVGALAHLLERVRRGLEADRDG